MMHTDEKKRAGYHWAHLPMDIARIVCSPLLLAFRMKRITPEGKPYKGRIHGGAILAANHRAFLDTFVLGVAVWYRRMYFLAAEVVMKGRLRKWLLKGVGAVEIDRYGTDIEAIRKSVKLLKEGHLLAIYPQGGITEGEKIQSVKSGVALIALQAGVPIVPMYIVPPKHWYSRRVVVIGDVLDPKQYAQKKIPTPADMERICDKLVEEMNRCVVHQ